MYNIMGKYQLVNPVIVGTFENSYIGKNSDDAAKQFWENLTSENKYVTGNIPKFLFTLKDENTNELYHYVVKEKMEGRHADYVITHIDVNMNDNSKETFLNKSNEVRNFAENNMKGGKHRKRYDEDDSSSSDSSDQDLDELFNYIRLKKAVRPISYWWYTPSIYNVNTVFTPSFVAPLSPYVQLWIPN